MYLHATQVCVIVTVTVTVSVGVSWVETAGCVNSRHDLWPSGAVTAAVTVINQSLQTSRVLRMRRLREATTKFSVSPCGVSYFHRQGIDTRHKGPTT